MVFLTSYSTVCLGSLRGQVEEPPCHLFLLSLSCTDISPLSLDYSDFLCPFADCSLLPDMALSVDSSWHRWQWRVRDGLAPSPSEATPLLSPEKGTQNYNLAQQRVVFPNNNVFHQDWAKISRRYSGNRICTTKYTLFTFLPQNLWEQFHRYPSTC